MREVAVGFWERTRRNHGLEHATIALLLGRDGRQRPMAGYSVPAGFLVVGNVESGEVEDAAREALRRMQEGESGLAVSPFCGTNIVVAAGLSTVAALTGYRLARGGLSGFSRAFSNSVVAIVASRPLGRLVQERLTTSADVEGMMVEGVWGFSVGRVSAHWVSTSFA